MHLTKEQEVWLNQKGGRDEGHVLEDERGLYIELYHPAPENRKEKLYLPQKRLI